MPLVGVTDEGLGNTTWVAAVDGHVLIVDAERDPDPYLAAADGLTAGARASMIAADTHLHADFLSGAGALGTHGATTVLPAAAHARWGDQQVSPGEHLNLGSWRLEVLRTPGHTPEHVAYRLVEGTRPVAVFTGGSLLVGSVARTDLIDPADTEALTRALWRSINRELLSLPDDVLVLPTHGSGSFCSAAGGSRRWSTIGEERRLNPLLQSDESTFVRAVLDGLGTFPPYFLRLRGQNRLGPRVVRALAPLDTLTATHVGDLVERGATVIDVRTVAAYAAAHIPGSLANTLRPQFASWLGWLVDDPTAPLVFVTDDHTDHRELLRQCLNVGYDNVAGSITIAAWRAAGGAVRTTPIVASHEAAGRVVIDVRQASEFVTGHVARAAHVELGGLSEAIGSLPDGDLIVMCGHGERAASAASVLEAGGRHDVAVATCGPGDWAAALGDTLEV